MKTSRLRIPLVYRGRGRKVGLRTSQSPGLQLSTAAGARTGKLGRCLTTCRSGCSLFSRFPKQAGCSNRRAVKKGRCLPVFRFNKAFGIARDLKVFLNLQGGLTRGVVPSADTYKKQADRASNQADKLRKASRNARQRIKEQRKALRSKKQEISRLEKDLRNLAHKESFRLENELRAKEWRAAGELEPEVLPDFLIIGAQKCGTNTLYDLLSQHPGIERAITKELNYFNLHFEKGIEWYRSQLPLPRRNEEHKPITGEATPDYLFYPDAARRAAQVVPQARLIVLLRNPVDRAYSHYHHQIRKGRETLGFEEAIEAEKARLRCERDKMLEDEHYNSFNYRHFSYLSRGVYVDQLLRWSEYFAEDQMLVLNSEDFFERAPETLKLVLNFLQLPGWEPETWKIRNKGSYEQEMNPATRRRLEEYFEPHNRRLYEYLGMDFGW